MDKNIYVAYSLTKNNWIYCYISILSLIKNSKSKINIVFLYDDLTNEIFEHFNAFKNVNKEKCILNFIKINKNTLPLLQFSDPSWYRILVSELCPDIDKIIYMTGSPNLVLQDLTEFYNINISDNYIAASTDTNLSLNKTFLLNSNYLFDIALINCKKMREDKILNKVATYLKNAPIEMSDFNKAFNYIFKYKTLNLPFKYNFGETKERNPKGDLSEKPVIVNFSKQYPIYYNCQNSYKELWWSYIKESSITIETIQSYKLSATSAENSFNYIWLLNRIFPYIKPYLFRILIGFAIAIPLGLLDGVTALALKPYMDYVVGGKTFELGLHGINISISSLQMAYILPIGVILFAALQGILRYLNGYISHWTSQRITNDVKYDLFYRLIHMHSQFFDDNSSGIVISRYLSDPKTASAGIVDNIKTITTSFCGALGLIAVMLYSSWELAFIGVLVLCIAFIPVILIRKRIKEASNQQVLISGKITTNTNETYSGNKVISAYGLEDRQYNYFVQQTKDAFNISMSLYKRAGWMSPLMYLIASFGIATVLGVGTYLINLGQMTAGAFASFVTSLLLLYKPVKTLGNTLTGIQNIFVAMGRVFELFDLTPAIKEKENSIELQGLHNSIEFKDVTFEYVPNNPVLKNINLTIPKNQTLAIVGNSGGGKSTLVNLIPRFYDIKSGSITIDGTNVKDFSLKSLRHNISMVFQDNFLFSGSIKDNILMGNPNATTEELVQAIKSAHLQDMIQEFPDGLDTELGERGLTLSGGQRQRVAIARAMLRNAPIVILDEATSALDNESEAIVQKAMDNLMQNRTVFIIAHRLSTIKNADRIAVINEGELVELGTHEELMNIENGQYKALYEMQFKKQEVKN